MPAVIARSLPASLPSSPIPGATNPIIIKGMAKPRKLLNRPLKVASTLTTQAGAKLPIIIPRIIAIINLGNKPIFFITATPFIIMLDSTLICYKDFAEKKLFLERTKSFAEILPL